MIVEGLNELFFEKMSNNFNLAPVARSVGSYKEARRIHRWHEDKINNRFNRFSLAYYTVANRHTHFNFSLYIDMFNRKVYAFFDEIETERMVITDKEMPQCCCELSIANFYDDMMKFLSDEFTPIIKDYYAGTPFSFDRIVSSEQGIYSLVKFGDAAGLVTFDKQVGFHNVNLVFYPSMGRETLARAENTVFSDYGMLTCNTISLSVAFDVSGKFVYVTNGVYLWCVKIETFSDFMRNCRDADRSKKSFENHCIILLES